MIQVLQYSKTLKFILGPDKMMWQTHAMVTWQLHRSHLTTIKSHKTLHCFIPALEHLSRGGMSEDESDHSGEHSTLQGRWFKIIKAQWWSSVKKKVR